MTADPGRETARTSAKLVKPRQRPTHLFQHGRRDPLGMSSLKTFRRLYRDTY